jgi:hypothetical protein
VTIAGRFAVEAEVRAGGAAVIYRARDLVTGERVAVKVLGRRDPALAARFARAAALHARLDCPAVARYVAHGGLAGGGQYLAMEWIDGPTLAERLLGGPLGVDATLALGGRVAGALAAAHRQGIIHRDLKPSNLILEGGAAAQTRVLDFGIARGLERARAATGGTRPVGTPGYMAPEQARAGVEPDARVDVFALGCVLYECLTGRPAFVSEHPLGLLAKILVDEPGPIAEYCPEAPAALEALIRRILAKDREQRPRDGAAAAIELGRVAQGAGAEPLAAQRLAEELRVVSVVLAGPGPGRATEAEALGCAAGQPARVEILADDSVLVLLAGAATAGDQAGCAARCAAELGRLLPGRAIVIATGRATVTGPGAPPRLPVGALIDGAVRQLERAPAGAVCVDDITAGLLDAHFAIAGVGGTLVVTGVRSDEATRTVLGRRTPFLGRERELAAIEALFVECVATPAARAALIVARPGGGKSRLVREAVARLSARAAGRAPTDPAAPRAPLWIPESGPIDAAVPDELLVVSARGAPGGSPFGLVAAMLRRLAAVDGAEPLEVQRAKLVARIGRHLARPDAVMLVGELAGVPFRETEPLRRDPVLLGDAVRAAFEEWLAAECAARPAVLVLDDLQWGDLPTIKLVDQVLRNLADRPIFVLAAARPEVHDRFPELWAERDLAELRLAPLGRRAARALVREVLGADVAGGTVERLVERADGNAFFLKELMRHAAAGRDELPETVLATVQARLDALAPEARRVLRAASVFGLSFQAGGVAAILGDDDGVATAQALADLAARELVAARGGRYDFAHELLAQAAYAMLPPEDRAAAHRVAGQWLEWTGEPDARALAAHFEKAGELERAAAWYLRGAQQALAGNDLDTAIACAELGVALIPDGDPLGALLLVKAEALRWRGELRAAERHAGLAVERLIPGGVGWYQALGERAEDAGLLGAPDAAAAFGELAAAQRPLPPAEAARAVCLCRAAGQLYAHGRLDRGDALLAAAAAPPGDPVVDAQRARVRALRAAAVGDPELPAQLEQARAAALTAGDLRDACLAEIDLALAHAELGDPERAESLLDGAVANAERMGLAQVVMWGACVAGRARLMRRDPAGARAVLGRLLGRRVDDRLAAAAYLDLALACIADGAAADAEREAERAVDLAAPPRRAGALAALALARLARGQVAAARAAALQARATLGEHDPHDALVRLADAETLLAAGDGAAARAALDDARARLAARADTLPPELRAGFLALPAHARIGDLARAWL